VQLLYDSDHFHSKYIWICVFLQVRGKSWREAATACASSHRVAFASSSLSQTVLVSACRAITFMSATVYCTLLIMYSYYMLSHSIVWRLLHDVYNILNMQRYATSVTGQTCRYSDKVAKGTTIISASMKTFHCYDIDNSVVLMRHHWLDRQAALGKLAMKMCGLQQDFATWKIYQEASADM